MRLEATIPLSLYLHIPWCIRKCPYCDFNSHQTEGCPDAMGYVNALLRDLAHESVFVGDRSVSTIFIGGGTPSLFPPEAIRSLLLGVAQRVNLAEDAEITMEANPGTLEKDWYKGYREAGVNRLSMGIQSFHDDALRSLGRVHDSAQAAAAIEEATNAGFSSFNLDLMFGLPGQTLELAEKDIETAIAFSPAHISYYQLTIEPNTLFYTKAPALPDDDLIALMQESGQQKLAAAGYGQYEVSAYAKPGMQCRHNLNYWLFGDYMGIGAGAHGKLSSLDGVQRRWRVRHPEAYLQGAGTEDAVAGERLLSKDDLVLEFMMNALRLNDGFEVNLFERRTGIALMEIASTLTGLFDRELLVKMDDKILATDYGRLYLNEILGEFCS